ncbi:hypothetical protein B0T25DRAFT_513962 [Lasiosphaeria hispida]|uniref:Uncharacterized protein n=1 Tax=Lasiosphaeria hispida TaxID=260671 RepID=A0AAJ0MKX1_9PEZI|nr:hypothetical protein B0T25DRAFT_513962 [Lasiosphaeria hispida]
MSSLQELFSAHPQLWMLQSKTLDRRVVNGALIVASNPTFANWLASGPLTEYARKMLENHPLHDVWVGSAFIDRVDNSRFFYNFARGEVPADVIEGLITAATTIATTQFVRCQDCIGAWEARVYWFDDCYAHDDPEHRACASCDIEGSECCDVTFSDNRSATLMVMALNTRAATSRNATFTSNTAANAASGSSNVTSAGDDSEFVDSSDDGDEFWHVR